MLSSGRIYFNLCWINDSIWCKMAAYVLLFNYFKMSVDYYAAILDLRKENNCEELLYLHIQSPFLRLRFINKWWPSLIFPSQPFNFCTNLIPMLKLRSQCHDWHQTYVVCSKSIQNASLLLPCWVIHQYVWQYNQLPSPYMFKINNI